MNRMVTSSVHAGAEMAAEAEEFDGAYARTLQKLEKFSKGAKQHTKLTSHKTEWAEEWQRLESQRCKLEADLAESAANLSGLGEPEFLAAGPPRPPVTEASTQHSTVLEDTKRADVTRRALITDVSSRWKNLHGFVAQFVAAQREHQERGDQGNGLTDENDENAQHSTPFVGPQNSATSSANPELSYTELSAFRANLAQTFLESRSWLSDGLHALDEVDNELTAAVGASRRAVCRMVAEDLNPHRYNGSATKSPRGTLGSGSEGVAGEQRASEEEAEEDAEVRAVLTLLGEREEVGKAEHADGEHPNAAGVVQINKSNVEGAGHSTASVEEATSQPPAGRRSDKEMREAQEKATAHREDDEEYEVLMARAEVADRVRQANQKRSISRKIADEEWRRAAIAAVRADWTGPLPGEATGVTTTEEAAAQGEEASGNGAFDRVGRTRKDVNGSAGLCNGAALGDGNVATDGTVPEEVGTSNYDQAEAVAVEAAACQDPCGGWPPREHSVFETLWKQLKGAGRTRDRALERLGLTLPHRSRRSLIAHAAWCDAGAARQVKRREANEKFARERTECVGWAHGRLAEARKEAQVRRDRAQALIEAAARGEALKQRLEQLQPGRDAAASERAALEAERAAAAAAEAQARSKQDAARSKARRAAVAAYRDERAAAAATAQKEAAAAAQAAAAAAAARGVQNARRVEYRGERRQGKLDELAELQWRAQRRAAARLEAIAAIAASVPYAAALAATTADVNKPTAASTAWCDFVHISIVLASNLLLKQH
jgi:hypothetical protein